MTLTAKQITLLELSLVTLIVAPMICVFCAMSIAYDVHQARLDQVAMAADWKRQTFRRVDEMEWKMDSALELAGAFKIDFGTLLTKIRAQVKQSSDETQTATNKQTKAATVAVTEALKTTTAAIQVVADQAGPPTVPLKPVVVNVPAPVVITPAAATNQTGVSGARPGVFAAAPRPHRRWFRKFWPWGR